MSKDLASLPKGWKVGKLGDIALENFGGGTPSTKHLDYWNGDIPWVTTAVLNSEDIYLKKYQGTISEKGLKNSSSRLAPKGSVLIGTRVGLGKAVITNTAVAVNQDITVVILNQDVLAEFLVLQIKQSQLQTFILDRKRGTTIKGITRSEILSLPISLPPLEEQRAIATTLRTIQTAKEARQKELASERERKVALMDYLFTHGTRNEPRKQTELGEIPESWELSSLGSICDIVSGGTPSRNEPEYWNGDIPWIKTGEIRYGIITNTEERITEIGLRNSSARMIPMGTVLMAMYGQGVTRGRVAILGIDATINQACAAIINSASIRSHFLFYFLSSSYEKIRDLGYGANQKNLNSALIKSILIPRPPMTEQQEIADILNGCDAKIATLEREINLHDELFRAMLEELMTGQLSSLPLAN